MGRGGISFTCHEHENLPEEASKLRAELVSPLAGLLSHQPFTIPIKIVFSMAAGQNCRGLADILPFQGGNTGNSQQPGAVNRLQLLWSASEAATGKIEGEETNGENETLREQVNLFEDQVRKLIGRINWLQENLQQEEESRSAAELQAECLGKICAEQTVKLEELSHQICAFFEELDQQHKQWADLETKLEVERRERLKIEARLDTVSRGAQARDSEQLLWSSAGQNIKEEEEEQGKETFWENLLFLSKYAIENESIDCQGQQQNSKAMNMFKQLSSQWTNYKAQGKLGNWSLAKVLRRLSFTDVRKKHECARSDSRDTEGQSQAEEFGCASGSVYNTVNLTEEIFNLNSEASDVRQKHLADLRKRLEFPDREKLQEDGGDSFGTYSHAQRVQSKAPRLSKSVSDLRRSSNSLRRSGADKIGNLQAKKFEADRKSQLKIENLGRQIWHLKKLYAEKTQLLKAEKRRRHDVDSRNYVLVKSLEKQVLQLKKLNVRKADEIKQERSRRHEAENKNVAEVETLERQVMRLSKLAAGRAHDLKREQKQRVEAERKIKDLSAQLKLSRVSLKKEPRSLSVRNLPPSRISRQGTEKITRKLKNQINEDKLSDEELNETMLDEGRDDEEFELEALQFRKVNRGKTHDSRSGRQIWKFQSRHKDRILVAQLKDAMEAQQSYNELDHWEQEVASVSTDDQGVISNSLQQRAGSYDTEELHPKQEIMQQVELCDRQGLQVGEHAQGFDVPIEADNVSEQADCSASTLDPVEATCLEIVQALLNDAVLASFAAKDGVQSVSQSSEQTIPSQEATSNVPEVQEVLIQRSVDSFGKEKERLEKLENEATSSTQEQEQMLEPKAGSLTKKIGQLKDITARLLRDLEGAQVLMNSTQIARSDFESVERQEMEVTYDGGTNKILTALEGLDVQGKESSVCSQEDIETEGLRETELDEKRNNVCVPEKHPSLKERMLPQKCAFRIWSVDGEISGRDSLKKQIRTEQIEDLKQERCWILEVKARLEILEKHFCRLKGLAFDRIQDLQEQLCKFEAESRILFETNVNVLESQIWDLRKITSENAQNIKQEQRKRHETELKLVEYCLADEQSFHAFNNPQQESSETDAGLGDRISSSIADAIRDIDWLYRRHSYQEFEKWKLSREVSKYREMAWRQGLLAFDQALLLCAAAFFTLARGVELLSPNVPT